MPFHRSPNRRQHTALPSWRKSAGVRPSYFIYFALLPREEVAWSILNFYFFFVLNCSRTETRWDLMNC